MIRRPCCWPTAAPQPAVGVILTEQRYSCSVLSLLVRPNHRNLQLITLWWQEFGKIWDTEFNTDKSIMLTICCLWCFSVIPALQLMHNFFDFFFSILLKILKHCKLFGKDSIFMFLGYNPVSCESFFDNSICLILFFVVCISNRKWNIILLTLQLLFFSCYVISHIYILYALPF